MWIPWYIYIYRYAYIYIYRFLDCWPPNLVQEEGESEETVLELLQKRGKAWDLGHPDAEARMEWL